MNRIIIFHIFFQKQNQPCSCGKLHDKCGPKLHSNDFRRIFRLTRPCFEEFCNILSTRPEMQVHPNLIGRRERVGLAKNCFN